MRLLEGSNECRVCFADDASEPAAQSAHRVACADLRRVARQRGGAAQADTLSLSARDASRRATRLIPPGRPAAIPDLSPVPRLSESLSALSALQSTSAMTAAHLAAQRDDFYARRVPLSSRRQEAFLIARSKRAPDAELRLEAFRTPPDLWMLASPAACQRIYASRSGGVEHSFKPLPFTGCPWRTSLLSNLWLKKR